MPDRESSPGPHENNPNSASQSGRMATPLSFAAKMGGALFGTVVAPLIVAVIVKYMDSGSAPPAAPIAAPAEQKAAEVVPQNATPLAANSSPPASSASVPATTTPPAAVTPPLVNSPASDTNAAVAADPAAAHDPPRKRRRNSNGGQAPKAAAASPFTSLFNGTDLKGWKAMDSRLWGVDSKTHVLIGKDVPDSQKNLNRWIFTEQDYTDFRLRCGVPLGPNTNSGFAVHTHPGGMSNENDRYEIQLTNDPSANYGTGTIFGLRSAPGHPNTKSKEDVSWLPRRPVEPDGDRSCRYALHILINDKLIRDARSFPIHPKGVRRPRSRLVRPVELRFKFALGKLNYAALRSSN